MNNQDLLARFREKLRAAGKEGKYARRFTAEDEERVCKAFALALENAPFPKRCCLNCSPVKRHEARKTDRAKYRRLSRPALV